MGAVISRTEAGCTSETGGGGSAHGEGATGSSGADAEALVRCRRSGEVAPVSTAAAGDAIGSVGHEGSSSTGFLVSVLWAKRPAVPRTMRATKKFRDRLFRAGDAEGRAGIVVAGRAWRGALIFENTTPHRGHESESVPSKAHLGQTTSFPNPTPDC
jgi:hypothetical protein